MIREGCLFDERPDNRSDQGIADAEDPALRPVQVGVGGAAPEDAQGVEGVVNGPFQRKRLDAPVFPYQAVGKPLAHGQQFPLKRILIHQIRAFEVNVVREHPIGICFLCHGSFASVKKVCAKVQKKRACIIFAGNMTRD